MDAEPARVFRALVTADEIVRWRFPTGMSCTVHAFEGREGGAFRVSLSYQDPDATTGKSDARTDTYRGRFVEVVADRRVVEEIEFETDDPAFGGTMVLTTTLTAVDGGTLVEVHHEGLPAGVRPADNETGSRLALSNLAALVESG
jgi:uncharacterized protein YndB with AHSA1/START domain